MKTRLNMLKERLKTDTKMRDEYFKNSGGNKNNDYVMGFEQEIEKTKRKILKEEEKLGIRKKKKKEEE